MGSEKNNAYQKARREKTVFWQSDSRSSRWRRLTRALTRELKQIKPWKLRELGD